MTTHTPLLNPPDIAAHTGLLLAEDEALKSYLGGIIIPAFGHTKEANVEVWFRWPEGERQIKYPYITIDLLAVEPLYELFQSEHIEQFPLYIPSTSPTFPTPAPFTSYSVRNYLPLQLIYQVGYFARSNLHDRYLRSIFMTDIFPPHPFWIGVDADLTYRRLELIDSAGLDSLETTESGTKRIFHKAYTLSMFAEMPQERVADSLRTIVQRSLISVSDMDTLSNYFNLATEGQLVNRIP